MGKCSACSDYYYNFFYVIIDYFMFIVLPNLSFFFSLLRSSAFKNCLPYDFFSKENIC